MTAYPPEFRDHPPLSVTVVTERGENEVERKTVMQPVSSTETWPPGNDPRDREPPNRATRRREAREARLSLREEKRARAQILAERDAAYHRHRGEPPNPRELLDRERRMHAARSSNRNT